MNVTDEHLSDHIEKPIASILIPTYRRPQLVCRAIEHCLQQISDVREHVEVVVVDNCPMKSAEAAVKARFSDEFSGVRYIHEPQTGVAFARNSALRNARGEFVIFLDDDQYPLEGWLAAFLKVARSGAKAAFGPVFPKYSVQPIKYTRILESTFTRKIPVRNGDDVSRLYPYLGTGNCLFNKAACFTQEDCFDERFNSIGGEDIWLLKNLCSRSISLIWAEEASVIESVPPERMTFQWLARRKFHAGQIRALLGLHPAQRRRYAVVFWMGVGAIQTTYCGLLYVFALVFRRDRAKDYLIRAAGGAGKLLWFMGRGPARGVAQRQQTAR
jgi:succinoglycan biosynthesis protein ExoM